MGNEKEKQLHCIEHIFAMLLVFPPSKDPI